MNITRLQLVHAVLASHERVHAFAFPCLRLLARANPETIADPRWHTVTRLHDRMPGIHPHASCLAILATDVFFIRACQCPPLASRFVG
jgi:hypothetical protein